MKIGNCLAVGIALAACQAYAADEPIYVLFTIDVESASTGNPERDVWCRDDDGEHGIGRMMDIFDAHGVEGTFFVNVYEAEKHGYDTWEAICKTIHQRGHDVELHTHPKPMFGVYGMQDADLDKEVEILTRGKELIKQWTGQDVVAHRAGAYAADLNTVKACGQTGIPLEFSLTITGSTCKLGKLGLTENAPVLAEGVLCVPVTAYVQASASTGLVHIPTSWRFGHTETPRDREVDPHLVVDQAGQ